MPIPENIKLEQDWIKANLSKFLMECPYFFSRDHIPPLCVLNSRLKVGEWQPSMNPGVNWEPFEIGENQYVVVVNELMSSGELSLKNTDYPSWVTTEDEWEVFLCEKLDGIPASEHLDIVKRVREAEKVRNDVMFNGKSGNLSQLSEAAILANVELDDFINRYNKKA